VIADALSEFTFLWKIQDHVQPSVWGRVVGYTQARVHTIANVMLQNYVWFAIWCRIRSLSRTQSLDRTRAKIENNSGDRRTMLADSFRLSAEQTNRFQDKIQIHLWQQVRERIYIQSRDLVHDQARRYVRGNAEELLWARIWDYRVDSIKNSIWAEISGRAHDS
jgi:hypothetical protein